ncbi:P-loop containing nucleoside triphosphate hydrolase protein [Phakopsora pachyrhizi]|uniref:P-loop containing nucleoside triphosphate hydrolase protein n=1 Tax=Phakopsora pachyrhizi TaxID=170000 RepID=A0AAV0B7X1_PHAPC|nr:P-loop containing nucleoside triphosphate hydrolase protein [Phakopsora pachyrhizi]CAH7682515.1 P-loop containing nucleoside triphosphate hydrolase protein [Phakopsora pachyrhizi]
MTDKNKDALGKDLLELIQYSSNAFITGQLFTNWVDPNSKKRPPDQGDKIKVSANALVEKLMRSQPLYIRTIKPNQSKSPLEYDTAAILHQIKYLGLQENVCIRRAGFAYRNTFEQVVQRFYLLSPATFNNKNTGNEFLKESPAWWVMYLKSHNFRELLATNLKRLRVALRTQTPFWTQEFIGFGGYLALLKRLKELLEIEWREEQHDDQVLYEILRCFKALLLKEPGRESLSSKLPNPFVQLTSLLYSEKRPGDLSSRQVIIELILGIFELNYNPRVISQIDWKALIDLNKVDTKSFSNPQDNSPAPLLSSSTNLSQPKRVAGSYDNGGKDGLLNLRLIRHEFVKKLLVGPPDLKKEQMVEFAVKTHRNRIF